MTYRNNFKDLDTQERISTSIVFLLVMAFLFFDIYEDLNEGASFSHVIKESTIILLGLIGLLILWKKYFFIKRQKSSLRIDLEKAKQDLSTYKEQTKSLTLKISEKIDQQLEEWRLTNSEKDVALLLLKGLSAKEIAVLRESSEKTVRHHCAAIYQKANLANRNELFSFFLDDIFIHHESSTKLT